MIVRLAKNKLFVRIRLDLNKIHFMLFVVSSWYLRIATEIKDKKIFYLIKFSLKKN
jgi:hypothetical protein